MRHMLLLSSLVLFLSLSALSQDTAPASPAPATPPEPPPAATDATAAGHAPEAAASSSPSPAPASPTSFGEVIDRVVEHEHLFMAQMRHMHPLVETYLQNMKTDNTGNTLLRDQYFLGRLDILGTGPEDTSFIGQPGFGHRMLHELTNLYALHFLPLGFAQMVVLDPDFQKKYYNFTFVRREFLGEVRCLVIDVEPKPNASPGRFIGRIWVEDQDYNVVRFNGTYHSRPGTSFYLHFDSWRLNPRSGMWIPAYIYSEESDFKYGMNKSLRFRAQTRLWGYDLKALNKDSEFTQILVDSPQSVKDQSDVAADASPVVAERMWERQAEDNAIERMQKEGLIAPPGDLDKVLQTVVNNLLVTNNIDLQTDVRCRVLLTSPLESFTVGHTIVVSRGLLDVLPDEASLAMVLAHELGHIVLGQKFDTKLAFNDRMFFPDEATFQHFDFSRDRADEQAADTKALELLKNSPYKDKLGNAGLFLAALHQNAPALPNLIRPHLGNSFATAKEIQMSELMTSAPQLDRKRLDQIAALPLGGRVKLDPWSDQVELAKAKPVVLTSAKEKIPFEVTPFFPYLTHVSTSGSVKAALNTTTAK
jgi:Peptidase family M48